MTMQIMRAKAVARVSTRGRRGGLLLTLLLFLALPLPVLSQDDAISPQAVELLRTSTDFLAQQERFSLDTVSSIDFVLASGQKLQFDHTTRVLVQRPNQMRAERTGELVDQVLYYDGKSLTLHNPAENAYATVSAPNTLEAMLEFAGRELGIVAPAADLLYTNAFDILMQDVTSGMVVGKSAVAGTRCDHLAFRAPHVDWQIWIEEGDRPLMCKLVITTTDMLNAPQFTVIATDWNLDPGIAPETFVFSPQADTRQVGFLPDEAAPSAAE